ncbi:serine--tRNA ligase [candidate division WWE3 bacterium]|nr:serine--tRNA ligase [candidate division WWE3 bacterium]
MIDIKLLKEKPELVKKAIQEKKVADKVNFEELVILDNKYSELLQKVESHRALRNQLSSDISKVPAENREKLITEAGRVKAELKELEESLTSVEIQRDNLLKKVPNIIHESVPSGKDETENVVIKKWGSPKKFDFTAKDHIELGKLLGLIDTEKSSEISGTRFTYLFGDAVLLQFGLIQFVFESLMDPKLVEKLAKEVGNPNFTPFVPVIPPVFMRSEIMDKMDRLEPQDDRYVFAEDSLVLVGSAEHTMGPLHMGEILDDSQLPKRYIGYSTAFRREAGSYGKDTRGILRVHQFDKLELECFTTPETGLVEQDLLVAFQQYFVQQLEIPHQIVAICTGDMGKPDYRQIDIECFMPGQDKYRETHTSDYMTDYQARRLNIRYKKGGYVHMNDATAFAIGRILIAILENYQRADGSIEVPKILRKYVGKDIIR